MTRVVLDASVVVKWFLDPEVGTSEALALRADFERGAVNLVVPRLLFTEILNAAGRRQRWSAEALDGLAATLDELPCEIVDPPASHVAPWVAAGLTAYDATYVALAESVGCRVVTTDAEMLAVAPDLTTPLVPA